MTFPLWLLPPQKVKPLKTRIPARVQVWGKTYPSAEQAAMMLGVDRAVVRRMCHTGEAHYIK